MYIVAIAWLYVVMVVAVADTSVVGGVLTFVFWGLFPLGLFLWVFGTPARRRNAARLPTDKPVVDNDRAESNGGQ